MVARRKLILSGATALLATVLPRHAAAADDPAGILTAIYTRVAKGKGDGGPVGFDPVTHSQDPDVKSFKVAAEKQAADKATVAVTIESHQQDSRANQADKTIHYDFVHEAGQWKIDDVKGAVDGSPWSVRALLVDSLKY